MNNLYLIPSNKIPWNEIEYLIQDACEYNGNRYNSQDCYEELLSNQKQLWLVKSDILRAVIITALLPFPQKKCCVIDICTGEGIDEWIHLLSIIENWAKSNKCNQMFFVSRIGMQKKLKKFGYKTTHLFLEKNI